MTLVLSFVLVGLALGTPAVCAAGVFLLVGLGGMGDLFLLLLTLGVFQSGRYLCGQAAVIVDSLMLEPLLQVQWQAQ
ncbi:MAG: hypothetical protein WC829_16290 [Hyphomicrobium sp.]|jgi:hypothetical protein